MRNKRSFISQKSPSSISFFAPLQIPLIWRGFKVLVIYIPRRCCAIKIPIWFKNLFSFSAFKLLFIFMFFSEFSPFNIPLTISFSFLLKKYAIQVNSIFFSKLFQLTIKSNCFIFPTKKQWKQFSCNKFNSSLKIHFYKNMKWENLRENVCQRKIKNQFFLLVHTLCARSIHLSVLDINKKAPSDSVGVSTLTYLRSLSRALFEYFFNLSPTRYETSHLSDRHLSRHISTRMAQSSGVYGLHHMP